MAKKVEIGEIREAIKSFSDQSYEKYGSYSYAAGYYESTIAQLVAELPAHKQREFLQNLARIA